MFRSTRTGTVFVTASNSDERSRTETDYICNGTADDVEIQAAVDSLPTGGGMVVLSEGTFTLSATVTRSIANITIMGMGMGTRLVNNASTKLISDGAQAGWAFLEFDVDAGDITASGTGVVSDYWVDGTRQGSGATLTTEEVQDIAGNLIVTGGTKTGIAITYDDANNDMDYIIDHDAATNFVANKHLLVGAIDHDSLLNFETKEHFPNDGAFPTTWSDTSITGAELEDLSDGGATTIHSHAAGSGDVVGDTASIDKELVRFNSTTGKIIESPNTDLNTTTATLSDNADLTLYDAVNDGNPEFRLGSSDTEELHIRAVYLTSDQILDYVIFQTDTGNSAADRALMRFNVDGLSILDIDDGGINIAVNKGISIAGIDIITDSTGTTTLSNIDVIDATTIATFNAALTAGDVVGDTASIDKELVRFNSTTGKIIESPRTDNANVTATLSDGADLTLYDSANDANPLILIGASATERLGINPVYKGATAELLRCDFFSDTGSSDADAGEFRFTVDSTLKLTIDDGGLEVVGSVMMKEQAAADADIATYGQFWVRNDIPNTPMFTGDTGIDQELGLIHVRDTQIAHADILTLRATPYEVIPAPGAGLMIIFDRGVIINDHSIAYTETNDNLRLQYDSDGTDVSDQITASNIVGTTESMRMINDRTTSTGVSNTDNAAVVLDNEGDAEWGAGNSSNTLSLRLWYWIMPAAKFPA